RRPCFSIASSQRKIGIVVTFTTFQVPIGAGRLFDPGVIGKEAMTRLASARSSMRPSCINSNDALSELWSWRQIRHRLNSFDLEGLHIGYLDRAAFFQIVQIPT